MSAFDGNQDGFLNPLERVNQNEFRFGDINRDSALNIQEFSAVENPREFGLYDTNRDSLVDAPEYARGEAITEHRFGF